MRTMTSLEAQNHFGEMIDTSQQEPVLITRRGRPVSFVFSPYGDFRTILVQFMQVVSKFAPLRGKQAAVELTRILDNLGQQAEAEQLTEADIIRMIDESA